MPTIRGGYGEVPSWGEIRRERDSALLGGKQSPNRLLEIAGIVRVTASWQSSEDSRTRLTNTEFRSWDRKDFPTALTRLKVIDFLEEGQRRRAFTMRIAENSGLIVARERLIPHPDPDMPAPQNEYDALVYLGRQRPIDSKGIDPDEALTIVYNELQNGAQHNKPGDI